MSEKIIKLKGISNLEGVSRTSYKPVASKNSTIDGTTFLAESLYKEVINQDQLSGKRQKIKSLKKLQKGFMSILVTAIMASPSTTFAQSTGTYQNLMPVSSEPDITPDLIMTWGFTIALVTVAIGVAVAGSLMAVAGVFRMLRKREEAEEWTTDIIKGLVQVLIAIPVVYSLFYLAQIVFKRIPFLDGLL